MIRRRHNGQPWITVSRTAIYALADTGAPPRRAFLCPMCGSRILLALSYRSASREAPGATCLSCGQRCWLGETEAKRRTA